MKRGLVYLSRKDLERAEKKVNNPGIQMTLYLPHAI
jgi:hypothetical protein